MNRSFDNVFWRAAFGVALLYASTSCGGGDAVQANGAGSNAAVPFGSTAEAAGDVRELVVTSANPGISPHFVGADDDAILLLELDPQVLEPVLLARPKRGISARDAMRSNGFSAVIGSGFVSELHTLEPVGLLQVDGETHSPVQGHGYTRILGINDAGIGVVHREAYQRDLFHSALQAGPGIVEEGLLDISERDLQRPKYYRSFVAVCENRWLAGVSLAPSHLRTLGQTLLRYIEDKGWQCGDVVNLAGDRQAVMLLKADAETIVYHGDPDTYKVSLLGFKPAT